MWTRRALIASGFAVAAAPAMAADAYALALQRAYGGPIDPMLAYRLAAAEVRTLQARADKLLRGQGLTYGPVAQRLRDLALDPRWIYPDSDAGRERVVADIAAWLDAIRPKLTAAFGNLPIAAAKVSRMSPADEAARRAGYREAPSGGKPGLYYIDLASIRARPKWTLCSVAYHELIPGHLLQLPLQAAANPPPERLRDSAAYFEAWAIYAEQLCADLGAYAGDPLGEIGYLQWRLFRIGRAVVDIGLGAMGWSRDDAITAMTDIQGQSIAFISIPADVDRIMAAPGRYAAEGLGALEMRRLRPAKPALWPAYHRALLADGPWPIGALEKQTRL